MKGLYKCTYQFKSGVSLEIATSLPLNMFFFQFTKQAKKAAESLETAGKSAVEASKYKAIAKEFHLKFHFYF